MKIFALVAALCLLPAVAGAQSPNCKTQAADKKLAGAAKNSFVKKCTSDAVGAT